jgi:hypothetical protein
MGALQGALPQMWLLAGAMLGDPLLRYDGQARCPYLSLVLLRLFTCRSPLGYALGRSLAGLSMWCIG